MVTEINSPGAATAPSAVGVRTAMTGELLRLLQPQSGLLPPGGSAHAEVLSLRQVGQSFDVLLRLTLANGSQTQVQANASQPLLPGTQFSVNQPDSGRLAVLVQQTDTRNAAALTQIDTRALPVGSLVQGKVQTSQAIPVSAGQPLVFRSLITLLTSAQAGAMLVVDSPRALPVGSLLSAVVQGDQALRFVPLTGRQDDLAISQQLQTQQARQASLPGVLGALQAWVDDADTPATLRASAQQLLAGLPTIGQLSDARAVAQALRDSGVFLEGRLLNSTGSGLPTDLKANLLRLSAQAQPGLTSAALAGNTAAALPYALPGLARGALSLLDRVGPRPQPGAFPTPSRVLQGLDDSADLQQLLRLTAAALARLQNHQLTSLQQTGIGEAGERLTTWQTELPVRQGDAFIPVQVRLQREDPAGDGARERGSDRDAREPLTAVWHLELAFDLSSLGPLHIQAQLREGRLSGQLWAEQAATARLIDQQLSALRERLVNRGLEVGDLACHPGTPPQGPRTRLDQRWVDETA